MRTAAKKNQASQDAAPSNLASLRSTDRLLMLLLLKLGSSQTEIASVLGISQQTVSRMLGGVKAKRAIFAADVEE